MREVANTNRRLLANYKGADGIKTGYTRAAGFNLVASAERGNERVIATVFGGKSTASRNARVAELLDMGFRRAPSRAPLRKPQKPGYTPDTGPVVVAGNSSAPSGAGKVIRVTGAVKKSLRPQMRPVAAEPVLVASATTPEPSVKADDILTALEVAQAVAPAKPAPVVIPMKRPAARPGNVVLARAEPEVVTRLSTSGGRHWGVNVGRYPSRYKAEKVLLQTALTEMSSLDGSLRKVVRKPQGFDANFMGLTREGADLACRRLQARNVTCFTIGPQS